MTTAKTHASLQRLEEKIKLLLERYQDQKKLVQQLQAENAKLKQQQEKLQTSSEHTAASPLAKQGQRVSHWTDKLHSYIQKIDQCIARLEQHP